MKCEGYQIKEIREFERKVRDIEWNVRDIERNERDIKWKVRDIKLKWMKCKDWGIYIIKQDIRLYVPYSRPNDWTDWAESFCGHSGVAAGCYRLKKSVFFFQ